MELGVVSGKRKRRITVRKGELKTPKETLKH
jgi:hypothetical protein